MTTPAPLNTPPAGGAYYQLNRRQQVFVDQLVLNGGNILEAYRHAGYISKEGDNERSSAWHLAHRADIRRALLEVVRGGVAIASPGLFDMLKKIAGDERQTTNHRLKATQILLEYGGVQAPAEQQVNVSVQFNRQQYERMALTILGKMTPEDQAVIEAEYSEVKDANTRADRPDASGGEAQEGQPNGNPGPAPAGEGTGGRPPVAGPQEEQRDGPDPT